MERTVFVTTEQGWHGSAYELEIKMHPEQSNPRQYPESTQQPYYEDEIDLRELFMVLWKGKWWIIGTTFIAAIISVTTALWLPNIYRAEVLLVADEEGGGAFSGLASQYGGLAGIAGITLPQEEASEKDIGLAILRSRRFFRGFVESHQILPDLLAVKAYDPFSQTVVYDSAIYDVEAEVWTTLDRSGNIKNPSMEDAYEKFNSILSISVNGENGFIRLGLEHMSPQIAAQWLDWIVEELNKEMMKKATSEAQQSIDFLKGQLEGTQIVALEEVFYSLIEEQTKTIMLANSRVEYLFETLDPAIVPEKRVKPRRSIIAVFGTVLGGFLGLIIVWLRYKINP